MRKILEKCPGCGEELIVTRLSCPACDTVIKGNYSTCRFCKLSQKSLEFIDIFVKNRGNIKEMERELGISYPTVRSRLDSVIKELGYEVDEEDNSGVSDKRKEILRKLDAGEISASEAAEILSKLK